MGSTRIFARLSWLGALAALLALPLTASAQETSETFFITADVGVSGPLNNPVNGLFGPGASGGVGFYHSVMPELALGGRVSGGFLGEGNDIPQDPVDRDVLDYGMIGPSLRIRPAASAHEVDRRATGLYIDLNPGLALTDGHVLPAYTIGAGYNFAAGPVAIGPMARFTHLIETEGRFGDNHIAMITGGVEIAFMDEVEVYEEPTPVFVREEEPEPVDPDRDGDFIVNERDACPDTPEVYNGFEDVDGCPDEGRGELVNDALVVDERVFFDFDEAHLRQTGIDQLQAIVEHYQRYGDRYERLVISGHTDVRGTEPYNEELSEERARAVRRYLVSQGIPDDVLIVRAHGEERPEVAPADEPLEHQINRRVEFRVEWQEGMRPEGTAPEPTPTMPEYVDRDDDASGPQARR